jgi:hypothetical protein
VLGLVPPVLRPASLTAYFHLIDNRHDWAFGLCVAEFFREGSQFGFLAGNLSVFAFANEFGVSVSRHRSAPGLSWDKSDWAGLTSASQAR